MTKSGEFSQQATQDAAWDDHCDLLVAGSGAAGLAAALAAAAGAVSYTHLTLPTTPYV